MWKEGFARHSLARLTRRSAAFPRRRWEPSSSSPIIVTGGPIPAPGPPVQLPIMPLTLEVSAALEDEASDVRGEE